MRASESPIGFGRRGERVANVPCDAVVEEGRTDESQPSALVQVREHPDVGEAVEVGEAAAVRLGDLDRRLAARVRHRLERHAVELRVRGGDVADRSVDDRLRRFGCRAAPRRRRGPRARPTAARARAFGRIRLRSASWRSSARSVRASAIACSRRSGAGSRPARSWKRSFSISSERRSRTCSTGAAAPALERRAAAPRRAERRPGRPGVARVVPRVSARPASRSCASARYASGRVHEYTRPISPAGASACAIAQPCAGASQSSPSAAHSGSDGSVRAGGSSARAAPRST